MKPKTITIILAAILWGYILFSISLHLSVYLEHSDFPSYYRAANIIIDPDAIDSNIYLADDNTNVYNIPAGFVPFRYSMLIAYAMSPLALMPFLISKAIVIFLNIIMYLTAIGIALYLISASGKRIAFGLVISIIWMPFLQNIRFIQMNAVAFFFIALAILTTTKKKPILGGVLLGLAALIKPFPFAIAMVLGLKNWRVFAGCTMMVGFSMFLPGTHEWFGSFNNPPHPPVCYSVIYNYLIQYGLFAFAAFSVFIAGTTALIAYRNKSADYFTLTSFAIPAALLAMPIVEMHHLTALIFTYIYFIIIKKPSIFSALAIILSFVLISIGSTIQPASSTPSTSLIVGLFVIWLVMALSLSTQKPLEDIVLCSVKDCDNIANKYRIINIFNKI